MKPIDMFIEQIAYYGEIESMKIEKHGDVEFLLIKIKDKIDLLVYEARHVPIEIVKNIKKAENRNKMINKILKTK